TLSESVTRGTLAVRKRLERVKRRAGFSPCFSSRRPSPAPSTPACPALPLARCPDSSKCDHGSTSSSDSLCPARTRRRCATPPASSLLCHPCAAALLERPHR
ncbi:hypothetical protein DMC30DRAFT_376278, partial [Rhodotorula diobovata]